MERESQPPPDSNKARSYASSNEVRSYISSNKARSYASSKETKISASSKEAQYCASQDVAYKLASYLLVAKSDKKAATIFAHTNISSLSVEMGQLARLGVEGSFPRRRESRKAALQYLQQKRRSEDPVQTSLSSEQKQKLDQIRQELFIVDQAYLDEKKDNFSGPDRAALLFKAKVSKFSGLNKEEKIQMYREAGYSEDEILKITGKKLLLSTGISTALTFASNGLTSAAIAHEKIIPFIENIPDNYSGLAVGASLITYIASYAYITEQDLRLTKKFGGSTNPYVTGVYLAGNRLLPDRARDWFARGLPIGTNSITHAVAIPAIIESVTANQDKIIAGSIAGSAFNVALAASCEIFLRKKGDRG